DTTDARQSARCARRRAPRTLAPNAQATGATGRCGAPVHCARRAMLLQTPNALVQPQASIRFRPLRVETDHTREAPLTTTRGGGHRGTRGAWVASDQHTPRR